MFQSISCLKYENDRFHYQLVDSDFTCEVLGTYACLTASVEVAGAVLEYKKRNLSVPKNIALIYLFYASRGHHVDSWFEYDRSWIDTHHPELEYGKKYYTCVVNQYKRLR